jgi:hypothetical protein
MAVRRSERRRSQQLSRGTMSRKPKLRYRRHSRQSTWGIVQAWLESPATVQRIQHLVFSSHRSSVVGRRSSVASRQLSVVRYSGLALHFPRRLFRSSDRSSFPRTYRSPAALSPCTGGRRQTLVVEARSCRHNGRIMWFVVRRAARKELASASLWPEGVLCARGVELLGGGLGSQCSWGA